MKSQMVKTVLLSAAGGAILWWIVLGVGFGWMPAGSAESKATERVDAALLDALAPICVAQFNKDTEMEAKFEKLKKASTWSQDDFVEEQGWATMPGTDEPETKVSAECARQILASRSL